MQTENIKVNKLKLNHNNPRVIKDDKYKKLLKSIKDFPKMLELRPIVVNDDMVVLGGNQRLKACKEAGYKEVPTIKASELTADEQREFIIKDNIGFGENDWDMLANEWNAEELEEWGMEIPVNWNEPEPDYEDLIGEEKNKPATLKITFDNPEQLQKAEVDIQELIDRKYQGAYFSVSAGEL